MNEKKQVVSSKMIKGVAKSLLSWLRENCNLIPKDTQLRYQELNDKEGTSSLSLHTLKGSVKDTVYVDGSYRGYYPFAIYYRTSPDSTNTRLSAVDLLDSIADWIDSQDELPVLTGLDYVTEVSSVANAVLNKRYSDGTEDYVATFELYFEHVEI